MVGGTAMTDTTAKRSQHTWLMRPGQVAWVFNVSPKTPVRWASAGRIAAITIGNGHHRFSSKVVTDHLVTSGMEPEEAERLVEGAKNMDDESGTVTVEEERAA